MKESGDLFYDASSIFSVPYSSCHIFLVITYAYNFDFNLAANNLTDIKPVNITVTDVITMTALPELAEEEKVRITHQDIGKQ